MALSNIFVEPRREITESLVGVVIVLIPITAWYLISSYLAEITWDPNHMEKGELDVCPYLLWVVFFMTITAFSILAAWFISSLFLIFTHFIGEEICAALQRRNINLLPKNRYKRNWRGEIERTN